MSPQRVSGRGVPVVNASAARLTGALLVCGVVAGPLFVTVIAVQVWTREGFDPSRHPLSALSLGDRGWIQIADFVIAGLLSVTFAVGLRRRWHPGPAGTAGPLLVGIYGASLVVAGVFVGDPGLGFPPGTGPGIPELSWHAAVHAAAPPVAFGSIIGFCFLAARRYRLSGRPGPAGCSAVTGIAGPALLVWPGAGGAVRTAVAVLIISGWLTAVAIDVIGEPDDQPLRFG